MLVFVPPLTYDHMSPGDAPPPRQAQKRVAGTESRKPERSPASAGRAARGVGKDQRRSLVARVATHNARQPGLRLENQFEAIETILVAGRHSKDVAHCTDQVGTLLDFIVKGQLGTNTVWFHCRLVLLLLLLLLVFLVLLLGRGCLALGLLWLQGPDPEEPQADCRISKFTKLKDFQCLMSQART